MAYIGKFQSFFNFLSVSPVQTSPISIALDTSYLKLLAHCLVLTYFEFIPGLLMIGIQLSLNNMMSLSLSWINLSLIQMVLNDGASIAIIKMSDKSEGHWWEPEVSDFKLSLLALLSLPLAMSSVVSCDQFSLDGQDW